MPLVLLASPAAAAPWQAEVLRLHNAERAGRQAAPLVWDRALAAGAEGWASELARSDRWGHSPAALRRGVGENLWMGTTGSFPVRAMVAAWIAERRWFRPGTFPAVSATGRWSDVGHYTQMISARTTRVGCALRSNSRWTYLVCRYGPTGNVDGLAMR